MNRRVTTILAIAFFIAALFTFLVVRLVGNRLGERPSVTTSVVAAKTDIKVGSILSADNLTAIQIVGAPPAGATLTKDEKSLLGRGVIADIYAGEPIVSGRLAAPGSGGGLAATIPPGMRACAVKVDDVVNVSGFVTPGARVDVLISGTPPGQQNSADGTVSKTLLQDIQVLSAGTDIEKDASGKPMQVQVVNLLVTPEQAEKLSLASNSTSGNSQTKIQLVLRNPLDTKVAPVVGTDTGDIFSGSNGPAKPVQGRRRPRKPAQKFASVQVINGSHESSEKFSSPGGNQ